MNALQFIQRLPLENDPCPDAFDFCENRTIAEAWNECRRPDWMLTVLGHIATKEQVKFAKIAVAKPIRYFYDNAIAIEKVFQCFFMQLFWRNNDKNDIKKIINTIDNKDIQAIFNQIINEDSRPAAVVQHYINWYSTQVYAITHDEQYEMSEAANRIRVYISTYEIEQMCARYESK